MEENVLQNFYNFTESYFHNLINHSDNLDIEPDEKYDTIYKTQQFPYKIDIILKKDNDKINQIGSGDLDDSNSILYFDLF